MILETLTIGGKPKETPQCDSCEGGKKWDNDKYFYEDSLAPTHRERICGKCLTKYKYLAKVKIDKKITESNARTLSRLISKDIENYEVEKIKMNGQEIVKLKEQYLESGTCNHPHIIESHPFKTSEGTFTIKSCLICRKGTVVYKGKTYSDNIEKLVSFIAREGVKTAVNNIGQINAGLKEIATSMPTAVADKTPTISFSKPQPEKPKINFFTPKQEEKKLPPISFGTPKPKIVF